MGKNFTRENFPEKKEIGASSIVNQCSSCLLLHHLIMQCSLY
jgi:hypothetical protein